MIHDFKVKQNLIALFAFFMPISLLLNINTIILILLLINLLFDIAKKEKRIQLFNWSSILILYFLVLLISLFYSEDLIVGQKVIIRSLSFLLLPFGLSTTTTFHLLELKKIVLFFYLGNVLAFFICLLYGLKVYEVNPIPLQKGFSYFTEFIEIHPSYFSIYFVFSTSTLLFLYNFTSKAQIILKYILIVFWIFVVWYLKSRAGILATSIILLIYCYHRLPKKAYFFLITILLFSFFLVNKSNIVGKISNRKNVSITIQERFEIWSSSIEVIKNNILIGVGVGDYQEELDKQYFLDGFDLGINHRLNAHNQFLQTLLSNGVVGFTILIAVFIILFKNYLATNNRMILFFMVSTFILMLFDSILILQHGILFFTFFSIVLLKANKR